MLRLPNDAVAARMSNTRKDSDRLCCSLNVGALFARFLCSRFCLVFILRSAVGVGVFAVVIRTPKLQLPNMNNFCFINGTVALWV